MLSGVDGVWTEEGGEEEEDEASWTRAHLNLAGGLTGEAKDELGLSSFKSLLEDDWYTSASTTANSAAHNGGFEGLNTHPDIKDIAFSADPPPLPEAVLLPLPADSSAVFTLDATTQPFFAPKIALSSLLTAVCSHPFDPGFDAHDFLPPHQMLNSPVAVASGFLGLSGQMGCSDLSPGAQFRDPHLLPPPLGDGFISGAEAGFNPMGFDGFENSPFLNRSKVLRPLEILPPLGMQPTLFQKRAAALRENLAAAGENGRCLSGGQGSHENEEEIDDSGLNYDSDEVAENSKEESGKMDGGVGNNLNAKSSGGGDRKGKKKGLPAKNLMAERRRRKKLNDRLYMLRSVVPKISKMDRASILGDAIEYLKELLQKISDLHNELESTPGSSLPATNSTSFHPSTPTPPTLPCRVKEELCRSPLSSPNSQPARVEVRMREGRAVNIHMYCARRPGLLLSTMRALDALGLDIQQAVISCFNGFALDVFRAEQCKDGSGVLPDEIKALLLHSAGFHGMI